MKEVRTEIEIQARPLAGWMITAGYGYQRFNYVDINKIKAEARKNGMIYLQEDGLRQVIQGRTSNCNSSFRPS